MCISRLGICRVAEKDRLSGSRDVFEVANKKAKSLHCFRSTGLELLLQAESLVETINTSTGVNQLLLAGVERVALRADFNSDVLLGGASGKSVATSTANRSLFVVGMDAFSHVVHLFLLS